MLTPGVVQSAMTCVGGNRIFSSTLSIPSVSDYCLAPLGGLVVLAPYPGMDLETSLRLSNTALWTPAFRFGKLLVVAGLHVLTEKKAPRSSLWTRLGNFRNLLRLEVRRRI